MRYSSNCVTIDMKLRFKFYILAKNHTTRHVAVSAYCIFYDVLHLKTPPPLSWRAFNQSQRSNSSKVCKWTSLFVAKRRSSTGRGRITSGDEVLEADVTLGTPVPCLFDGTTVKNTSIFSLRDQRLQMHAVKRNHGLRNECDRGSFNKGN